MTPREPNGRVKLVKELGFPIAISLIFISGFGFIGVWMTSNQDRLISSVVTTNDKLATALEKNANTFSAIQTSIEVQAKLLSSRTAMFELLTTQNQQMLDEMQKANEQMAPIPELRRQEVDNGAKILAAFAEMLKELRTIAKNELAPSATPNDGGT